MLWIIYFVFKGNCTVLWSICTSLCTSSFTGRQCVLGNVRNVSCRCIIRVPPLAIVVISLYYYSNNLILVFVSVFSSYINAMASRLLHQYIVFSQKQKLFLPVIIILLPIGTFPVYVLLHLVQHIVVTLPFLVQEYYSM